MDARSAVKLIYNSSTRVIPHGFVDNADKYRATKVRVGDGWDVEPDEDYVGPVALFFNPFKQLMKFSIHYYNGIMLDTPAFLRKGISPWKIDNLYPNAINGRLYRVDYVADQSGPVAVNIELYDDVGLWAKDVADLKYTLEPIKTSVHKIFVDDEPGYADYKANSGLAVLHPEATYSDAVELAKHTNGLVRIDNSFIVSGERYTSTQYLMTQRCYNGFELWNSTFKQLDMPLGAIFGATS